MIRRSSEKPIELSGVEAPCLTCGRRIAVTVPRDLIITSQGTSKRSRSLPARLLLQPGLGDPGLCLACRVNALPDPDRGAANYQTILRNAADAGIPDGAVIWPLVFQADENAPERWRGWGGRMLGIEVIGLPPRLRDAPGVNGWRFALDDGRSADVVIFQTVMRRENIPAELVFHSPPGTWPARLELRDWQRAGTVNDLKALMQGVEVYQALSPGRGRPPGRTTWTREQFLDELPRARAEFEERFGRKPADADLAAELGISKATLARYRRMFLPPNN